MFAAAPDPLVAHRVVKRSCIAHNLLDRFAVTTAAQRIVRVVVEGNIQHGTKIEIESENTQQATRDVAVSPNKIEIVLVAQLLRVRRFAADQSQTRNAAAFLIDGDDRLDLAEITQIIDQLSQLRSALAVAPEKNETHWLDASKHFRACGIKLLARNAAQNELTRWIGAHDFEQPLTIALGGASRTGICDPPCS